MTAGSSRDTVVIRRKLFEILTIIGSRSRSGAYLSCGVRSRSNIQPMWANARPLASAPTDVP